MTAGCPEYKCLYVGLERDLEVWRLRALDARRKELYSRGCTCVASGVSVGCA